MVQSEGPIIIEGPFTKNATLCSLLNALRPSQLVYTTTDSSGTSFGAAMLTLNSTRENPRDPKSVEASTFPGLDSYRQKWRQLVCSAK
ncbi:hypothetical protein [Thalassospira sp. UBA1131]|uniref:hypothetical protein n=1 Tax=Thalassospira sp. UBA1131 TaxID=1947672 RepID=UPI0039C91A54